MQKTFATEKLEQYLSCNQPEKAFIRTTDLKTFDVSTVLTFFNIDNRKLDEVIKDNHYVNIFWASIAVLLDYAAGLTDTQLTQLLDEKLPQKWKKFITMDNNRRWQFMQKYKPARWLKETLEFDKDASIPYSFTERLMRLIKYDDTPIFDFLRWISEQYKEKTIEAVTNRNISDGHIIYKEAPRFHVAFGDLSAETLNAISYLDLDLPVDMLRQTRSQALDKIMEKYDFVESISITYKIWRHKDLPPHANPYHYVITNHPDLNKQQRFFAYVLFAGFSIMEPSYTDDQLHFNLIKYIAEYVQRGKFYYKPTGEIKAPNIANDQEMMTYIADSAYMFASILKGEYDFSKVSKIIGRGIVIDPIDKLRIAAAEGKWHGVMSKFILPHFHVVGDAKINKSGIWLFSSYPELLALLTTRSHTLTIGDATKQFIMAIVHDDISAVTDSAELMIAETRNSFNTRDFISAFAVRLAQIHELCYGTTDVEWRYPAAINTILEYVLEEENNMILGKRTHQQLMALKEELDSNSSGAFLAF